MYLPSQLLPGVAAVIALPILAQRLTPTDLGVLTLSQSLVTLSWGATNQWLTSTVLRELPAARESGSLGRFSLLLLRGLGITGILLAGFAGLLAAGGALSEMIASNYWLIMAASAGLVFQNMAVTLFTAALRPRACVLVEIPARVGGIAAGIALVYAGHGVHGYLAGIAGSSLVAGILGLVAAWPRAQPGIAADLGASYRSELRAWISYGFPIGISAMVGWALLLIDRYLLAWLDSTAATGIYSMGAAIGDKALSIPALAFFTAARPLLFKAMEERGRAEVERLTRIYTRVLLLLAFPIIAVAFLTAPGLILVLASPRYYSTAAPVIPLAAIGALVWALALLGNTGLTTARRSRPLLIASVAALVTNIGANLVLIPADGIRGAAWATIIANATFLGVAQLWSRKHLTWRIPWPTVRRAGIAGAAGYAAALGARELPDSPLATFSGAAITCCVVYVLVLALLGERKAA